MHGPAFKSMPLENPMFLQSKQYLIYCQSGVVGTAVMSLVKLPYAQYVYEMDVQLTV